MSTGKQCERPSCKNVRPIQTMGPIRGKGPVRLDEKGIPIMGSAIHKMGRVRYYWICEECRSAEQIRSSLASEAKDSEG